MKTQRSSVKPRPAIFRALGQQEPPQDISVDGRAYKRIDLCKHDSWAATAVYQCCQSNKKVVCKFNRQTAIFGFPMKWLGRFLARREFWFYQLLSDVPNVPMGCGLVYTDGKLVPYAVAHDYVEGHPLGDAECVSGEFFVKLQDLLNQVHRHGVAYVDLHKRENIIVGENGEPYLIDFQVAVSLRTTSRLGLSRWLLGEMQAADRYHLMKHKVNCRPDLYGDIRVAAKLRPWWLNLHRSIAPKLRTIRRRLLTLLRIRNGSGMADSEWFAEDAFRVKV